MTFSIVTRIIASVFLGAVVGGIILNALGYHWLLAAMCGAIIGGSLSFFFRSQKAELTQLERARQRDLVKNAVFFSVVAALAMGVVAMWSYGQVWPMEAHPPFVQTFGCYGLITLGAAAFGVALGFLFGVPRAATVDTRSGPGTMAEISDQRALRPNTNLSDVSDWLTKTLIGAGLTQLTALPGFFRKIGESFVADPRPVVVGALIVFGIGAGFLGGYVFTFIAFGPDFARALRGTDIG